MSIVSRRALKARLKPHAARLISRCWVTWYRFRLGSRVQFGRNFETNGRLVVPVGSRRGQDLQVVVRSPEGPAVVSTVPCRFVPLVGEEGFEG